jgi:hypothetical protein
MMNQPNLEQVKLEDVLDDPNAKWADIRSAIKTSYGRSACTNYALICALSRRMSFTEETSTNDNEICPTKVQFGHVAKTGSMNSESSEEFIAEISPAEYIIPTVVSFTNPPNVDISALRQSINMMDFGVNHNVDIHDSIRTGESIISNCACASDGFMGWKHGSDCGSTESGSTNFSKECDSEGFLPWKRTTNGEVQKEDCEKAAESHQRGVLSMFKRMSSAGESRSSETKDAKGVNKPNSWKKCFYSTTEATPCLYTTRAVELDDVKQALKNITRHQDMDMQVQKQHLVSFDAVVSNLFTEAVSFSDDTVPASIKRGCSRCSSDLRTISSENSYCGSFLDLNDDTRDAIWIRSDGCVDIKKECRKLYLDDSVRSSTSSCTWNRRETEK